jgi:anti-anti-sigma regulatory factor
MNEHGKETPNAERSPRLPILERRRSRRGPGPRDLVVDLSGMDKLDVTDLALLLTAQQSVQKEDRSMWLAGAPVAMWHSLHSMGLEHFFRAFPLGVGAAA